jgi:hypothetical protein
VVRHRVALFDDEDRAIADDPVAVDQGELRTRFRIVADEGTQKSSSTSRSTSPGSSGSASAVKMKAPNCTPSKRNRNEGVEAGHA